ncbi:hypothetical protein F5Y14DRAFT_453378 [Nemania sp. NC0429]|nr:hypothetical protein F5Y14DRAFT_453378 [Nemania sp. NC0429]
MAHYSGPQTLRLGPARPTVCNLVIAVAVLRAVEILARLEEGLPINPVDSELKLDAVLVLDRPESSKFPCVKAHDRRGLFGTHMRDLGPLRLAAARAPAALAS